jgi:hypothetical protein
MTLPSASLPGTTWKAQARQATADEREKTAKATPGHILASQAQHLVQLPSADEPSAEAEVNDQDRRVICAIPGEIAFRLESVRIRKVLRIERHRPSVGDDSGSFG